MADEVKGAGPLTKKVGGQPAWVWIVGVIVLAVGVQWYRQRSAAATAAAAAATAQNSGQSAVDQLIGNGTGLPAGAPPPTSTTPAPMSTEQWLAAALQAAKNAGEDPINAARALSSFLNGGNLSYADTQVVNAALDAIGTTPPGFTSIPPGSWQTRPLPTSKQSPSTIVGFVQPANSPSVFAQYANGNLVSLGDSNSMGQALQSAAAAGVNTNVRVLPVSDPIFQNSDVVQNSDAAIQYLWGQKWAQYVAPSTYVPGRPDIVTDPATIQAANAAWQRSMGVLPSTWGFIGQTPTQASDAYAKAAFAAAFPQYTATGDTVGHTVAGTSS
jgi:hypothetical protein